MPYLIGVVLAAGLLAFFWLVGFDRDRVFYPTVLIVIASYYILFAVMGGSRTALLSESVAATVFLALAVVGFKKSLWLVAVAMLGHGVFDFFHARLIPDPGVPVWWPGFCLAFDAVAACALALILIKRRTSAI